LTELETALSIITALTSFITATVLIFTYRQDKRRDLPQFDLYSIWGSSSPKDPDRKPVGLHIQNPTKPINYCQIFCNGVALETPFGAYFQKGIYIHAGGSADYILPKNIKDIENAVIVVKDGKNKLKENKLKDVPHAL
jgi:hypothetical protein